MIDFTHETLVWFSKSYGLFYLIGLSVCVLIYACWPGNRTKFDHAARSVLNDEDGPWQ